MSATATAGSQFGPHPEAADTEGIAVFEPGPATAAHRLTGTVDVGSAAAVDQAEFTIDQTDLGVTGHRAGAVRG